jgi:YjbE family integral membrane protein
MDMFTMEFATTLLAIVVIDLVLAGDNAIVIALAARNVPRHLQRKAMLWGAAGAVVVRSLLTLMVVWILQFPGLLFLGGILLVWIAHRLLLPEHANGDGPAVHGANTFWGAIRTIVMADMVMGLDNVLGVAGAAHGSFTLVVLGLLISVPILVWGSGILLRYVERYPGLVYVGAGVLAFTAAKMMTSEPALAEALGSYAFTVPLIYVVTVFGVLWSGFVENHRRLESRISARLANLKQQRIAALCKSQTFEGEETMGKILIPVDGSRNSQHAVRHAIQAFRSHAGLEVHLLNVQTPLSRHVANFVSKKIRLDYYRDEAEKALRSMHRMLDNANVPHSTHIEVGNKAEVIARTAKRLGCDHIVMATSRKNSLARMLESSVTNRVLELTTVPVEVIAGDNASNLERYGIPTAVAATIGLLLFEISD